MKRLLLVAVMVLVSMVGMASFSRAAESQNDTPTMSAISNKVSTLQARANDEVRANHKMYYLTVNNFTGDHAITACDSGFHMAFLYEIQDPSKVQYAIERTTGSRTVYDSRVDPPLFDQASDQFPEHTGWVRTDPDSLTGLVRNCNAWRSSSDQQSGITMTRSSLWGESNGHSLYEESNPAAWWQATRIASCSQPEPVWCVEDPE